MEVAEVLVTGSPTPPLARKQAMVTLEAAMLRPAASFKDPREVVAGPWTSEQKYQVLRQWKYDIGQLHLATDENMGPAAATAAGETVSLSDIHAAMETLGYKPEADSTPTKGA
jgi:hypothetical protein